ncbi:MAG: response regulator transcription factor [Anaerolineae bacterium]
MKPIRVLLADDHNLVRAGIRALLQNVPEVQVVAEAANGREVLERVAQIHPDVVLMDIAMPELNGLDATAQLVKDYPDLRIIILSMHETEAFVLAALRAGASGYLLKGAATPELEQAIQAVARGETYLSTAVSGHVIDAFKRGSSSTSSNSAQAGGDRTELTPRQRQVLQLIAEGHSTKEIAQKLSISVKTAKTHRTELMRRLDVHDVAGLVRYAMQIGLVVPDG